MAWSLRILVVEDDPKLVSLIAQELADALGPCTHLEFTSKLSIACESLADMEFDAIIVDLRLANGLTSATATVSAIRARAPKTPLFVLLERGSELQGIESIEMGATGCLFKHELESRVWLRKVCGAIERRRARSWTRNS